MAMFSRLLGLSCVLTLLFVATPAIAQRDKILVDHVDTSKYKEKGRLRFYLDILDKNNRVIKNQSKKKLKFFFNEDPIEGELVEKVELQEFKDIKEPLAISILMTNYLGFVASEAGEQSLFIYAKAGVVELLKGLTENFDKVSISLYNEDEQLTNPVPFTGDIKAAIEDVQDFSERKNLGDDYKPAVPPFYQHLKKVLEDMTEEEDLPRRRILLIVSDGASALEIGSQRQRINKKIGDIVELAVDNGIKIYAYCAYIQEDRYIPFLKKAANKTNGIAEVVKSKDAADLEPRLRSLAKQLKKQYVVDVFAAGLPSEDKGKFRVEAQTPSGQKIEAESRPIKLPETPTNWWGITKWILIILGSIFGLFFMIWLIKKIVGWRRNRPEPEYYEEEEEYLGPDRGKLRVRSGPQAGEVFPLTDDVCTIGSIDGNHVVIYDEGVSKRHAGIKIEDMRYELADFGSTNGTWVNGRKINKQFLRDSDEIRIGNTVLEFTLK